MNIALEEQVAVLETIGNRRLRRMSHRQEKALRAAEQTIKSLIAFRRHLQMTPDTESCNDLMSDELLHLIDVPTQ